MVNPQIDEGETFSFFARPNMQLGLPNHKYATQITPEGRVYTGAAEYVFFIEKKLLNKRIWTLKKGYLPAVCYHIERDNILYQFEIFQFWLDNNQRSKQINYIKIEVKNKSNEEKEASFAIGIKFHGKNHRPILGMNGGMQQTAFKRWKYEFSENMAFRGDKLIYICSKKPNKYWKDIKKRYEGTFRNYNKNKIVLISEFIFKLRQNQSEQIIIKIPHYPIEKDKNDLIKKIIDKNWDNAFSEFENFWNEKISKGMKIFVQERKVVNTSKTNLIFNFMTQDFKNSLIIQKVNRFQYNDFWIRDSSFYIKMYNMFGYPEVAKGIILNILKYQRKNGNFMSQGGQLDGFGQSLWAFSEHIKFTNDILFASKLFPIVEKAISWFKKIISKDKLGLLPPTSAFDNESIIGRYTGHNIWALIGLDSAIYLAKVLNLNEKVEEYQLLYKEFINNFKKQLSKIIGKKFIVPPGLNVKGGVDWGNLLLIYPRKIFNPKSKLVKNSFNHYYKNKMAEGLATWMGYLHHYLTERIAQSFMILGDQKKVLDCFYAMLIHTGSCNEGFEMGIFPYGDRDYEMNYILKFYNFPPHGWFGVAYNSLLRNMLIREETDYLHLLSVISPEWVKPGNKIIVENAHTYFGILDLKIKIEKSEIFIEFNIKFNSQPTPLKQIIIHIPYFLIFEEIELDNKLISINNEHIKIPVKENFNMIVKWKYKKIFEMNYETLVKNYKIEYKKRFLDQK
ncbi:MAG: hypothetical protein ACTSPY_10895 [Candidatus Helarchaeota archaeon]